MMKTDSDDDHSDAPPPFGQDGQEKREEGEEETAEIVGVQEREQVWQQDVLERQT